MLLRGLGATFLNVQGGGSSEVLWIPVQFQSSAAVELLQLPSAAGDPAHRLGW